MWRHTSQKWTTLILSRTVITTRFSTIKIWQTRWASGVYWQTKSTMRIRLPRTALCFLSMIRRITVCWHSREQTKAMCIPRRLKISECVRTMFSTMRKIRRLWHGALSQGKCIWSKRQRTQTGRGFIRCMWTKFWKSRNYMASMCVHLPWWRTGYTLCQGITIRKLSKPQSTADKTGLIFWKNIRWQIRRRAWYSL